MKNIILLITVLSLFISCDKDTFKGKDQLPAATQTGANTVGCLVNGQVFLPHAGGINPDVNCFYQYVDGEYYFTMNFADLRNGGNKRVVVQTTRIDLQVNQVYNLNKNIVDDGDFTGGSGVYSLSSNNRFFTNTIQTGELKITKLDQANSIISGTFWFDAVNSAGEKVEIRQGRFDWNY